MSYTRCMQVVSKTVDDKQFKAQAQLLILPSSSSWWLCSCVTGCLSHSQRSAETKFSDAGAPISTLVRLSQAEITVRDLLRYQMMVHLAKVGVSSMNIRTLVCSVYNLSTFCLYNNLRLFLDPSMCSIWNKWAWSLRLAHACAKWQISKWRLSLK